MVSYLLTVVTTIAYMNDSKAICHIELCCSIRVILADMGYRGEMADKVNIAFVYILKVVIR